jgi:flagellar hook-associated protein 3 FlgL
MTRVSTLGHSNLLTAYALNTQSRLAEAQTQVGTGFKSQNYAGIARNTSRLVTLETQQSRASNFRDGIEIVQTRLKLMSTGVSSLDDEVGSLRGALAGSATPDYAISARVWQQADNLLKHVQDVLNMQDETGYLFGGVRRESPPVDTSYATINGSAPFPVAPVGGPAPFTPAPRLTTTQIDQIAASYYSGATDTTDLSVRIDDNVPPITYGLKADEDGFKYLIAGLHMLRQANVNYPNDPGSNADIDQAYLTNGLELITKAIQGEPTANYPGDVAGMRELASQIGSVNVTLDRAKERHVLFLAYAEDTISDIEQVDTAEAVTRLNADQLALQAAFNTLARLQETTLLNYL